MAKTIVQLKVFVASPGDVAEERDVVSRVVFDINRSFGRHLNISLEVIRWETDSAPGFGSDAQDVINEAVGDNYDLFIGILWKRFGTPTPRARSGTEEEFLRVYERFQRDPKLVRIMFYFKNAPFFPKIDELEELSKVLHFKQSLGTRGALYWEYSTIEEFSAFLRSHLEMQLQSWGSKWGGTLEARGLSVSDDLDAAASRTDATKTSVTVRNQTSNELDETGLYELGERVSEELGLALLAINELATGMQVMAKEIEIVGKDVAALNNPLVKPDQRKIASLINRAAEEMEAYARKLDAETPKMAEHYAAGFEAASRSIAMSRDLGDKGRDEMPNLLNAINKGVSTIQTVREQMATFRGTISSVPRITTALNRARRHLTESLDKLDREFGIIINLNEELLRIGRATWPELSRDK